MSEHINFNEGFTNLFSLLIFIIILILFLYFVYHQIQNIFKIENNEQNNIHKNNDHNNKKEEFMNIFSLNDFLFDVDDDGNFIEKDKKTDNKKNILENVIHKKNIEIKERENINNNINEDKKDKEDKEDKKNKENKENKEDQENKEEKKNKENNKDSIVYIVDKNSNKKHIHFTILNEKKLKYLDCNGFYDDHIMINVKDVKNREITKIINKIYNKYTFVYQTKDDNEPINYFIEYRPSQERFIKLYNQNEDKVFYLEKIFYKEDKEDTNNKSIPLYKIYYYANEIGTIYSNLVEDNNTKVYQMRLNYENGENNKNIIAFSFILYLSFLKEEF